MSSGTVSVKVNNTIGSYFKSCRGVRQGDPLSPFLFNIFADTLAKMISLAQSNKLIEGLVPKYINNGVAVLQYADDTIMCIQDNKEQATHLKLLLYLYESMSGLKINFAKSESSWLAKMMPKVLNFQTCLIVLLANGQSNTWEYLWQAPDYML
jgi:hypothetical protein